MDLETKIIERTRLKKAIKSKNKKNKKSFLKFNVNYFLEKMLHSKILKSFLSADVENVQKKEFSFISEKIKQDYRILFLSDLHIEIVDNTKKIKEAISETQYDAIILGGDYLDSKDNFETSIERLKTLIDVLKGSSKNIITVAGNHDDEDVLMFLSKETTLLLGDLFVLNDDVVVIGYEEDISFSEKNFEKINDIDYIKDLNNVNLKGYDNNFKVGVSHAPSKEKESDLDLLLSGHTHGGQVTIFGYAPINHCVIKERVYGYWKTSNGKNGITTSGVGCSGLAVRRGIKPEIVDIKITKK